jgi:hypothetical protein
VASQLVPFGRHYISGANDFSTQLGYAYTIPGLPATFGIEIEKRF